MQIIEFNAEQEAEIAELAERYRQRVEGFASPASNAVGAVLSTQVTRTVDVGIHFPDKGDDEGRVTIKWNEYTHHFAYFSIARTADTKDEIGWEFRGSVYATTDGLVDAIKKFVFSDINMSHLK